MDIRDKGWHLHMKILGVREAVTQQGSVMELVAHALTEIRSSRVPQSNDGVKEITIRLSNQPITPTGLEQSTLIQESESLIDSSFDETVNPREGESVEQFYDRLVHELHYDIRLAQTIAADAFGFNLELDSWLTDSRAIAFRKLNASQKAYDEADPAEYAALLSYCNDKYPERVSAMRLRC